MTLKKQIVWSVVVGLVLTVVSVFIMHPKSPAIGPGSTLVLPPTCISTPGRPCPILLGSKDTGWPLSVTIPFGFSCNPSTKFCAGHMSVDEFASVAFNWFFWSGAVFIGMRVFGLVKKKNV